MNHLKRTSPQGMKKFVMALAEDEQMLNQLEVMFEQVRTNLAGKYGEQ
jgi:hypothetical protein